jgi:murein DD-endopeptidase MepM/ murein hydrolase activator NlpD
MPLRRLVAPLLTAAVLGAVFPPLIHAEARPGFPVEIVAGPAPQPVMVDGRAHLVYELHLTSFAPWPITLTGIDVLGAGASPLVSYRGKELMQRAVPVEKVLIAVEPPATTAEALPVEPGHGVIAFIDLTLERGVRAPAELHHRFLFSVAGQNGETLERTLDAAPVAVIQEPVPQLRAPLQGSSWIAVNALARYDHRRAYVALDGRVRIAQRFAIDWVRLGPDGRILRGDPHSNTSYYGYGAEVLAVGDGRVTGLRDDLPDNAGSSLRSERKITLDNVVGNHLILDLGQKRFALYAHLQPGSLKVKLGERVTAGQSLALLGNSGNSDGPHLHFQLIDANSPLGAEGIPYELDSFTVLGVIDSKQVLDGDGAWQPRGPVPVVHRHEFPVESALVTFP